MSFPTIQGGGNFPVDHSGGSGGGGGGLPACAVAGNLLVCNGAAWVAGQANLASANAVTGVLGVANGGTGLSAVGAANTVLTSNGAVNAYATIVDANVSAAAAIAVTKLALGAANTVLVMNGAGTVLGYATIVNSNVAAGAAIVGTKIDADFGAQRIRTTVGLQVEDGTGLATVGSLRFGITCTFVARKGDNTLDRTLWNWATDTLTIGESNSTLNLNGLGGFVSLQTGGASRLTVNSTSLSVLVAGITFGSTVVSPVISQAVDATASVTGDLMTQNAQDVSGNTATTGGALLQRAGNATGAAGTHTGGAATFRGGDATGASGTRTGGNCTMRPGSGANAGGVLDLQNGAGTSRFKVNDTGIGFFAAAPVAQQTITGSRATGAALAALLTQLALTGLIVDGTVA